MLHTSTFSPQRFFRAQNAPKPVFGRGYVRITLVELTTLRRPKVGWGGYTPPIQLSYSMKSAGRTRLGSLRCSLAP